MLLSRKVGGVDYFTISRKWEKKGLFLVQFFSGARGLLTRLSDLIKLVTMWPPSFRSKTTQKDCFSRIAEKFCFAQ